MEKLKRKQERWQDKPKVDKTGQKYNQLTVTGFSHYKLKKEGGRKLVWNCVCDCGNNKKVENSNLVSGNVSSCGCAARKSLKRLHENNVKDDIAFEYLYRDYIHSAKKRNYDFLLSKEEFERLTKQNCNYCNTEPKQLKYKNGEHIFKRSSYLYNGIDRKDNNLGYTKENCVSCCRICNIAKSAMTVEQFLEWIAKVYNFNKDTIKVGVAV